MECRIFNTDSLACTQSFLLSNQQYPPLSRCLTPSIDANLQAISQLGAWWLLKIEHTWKTLLNPLKTSVKLWIAGPNWRMSFIKWGRRWSFILTRIHDGSTSPNASKTFPTRISRLSCLIINLQSSWWIWDSQETGPCYWFQESREGHPKHQLLWQEQIA